MKVTRPPGRDPAGDAVSRLSPKQDKRNDRKGPIPVCQARAVEHKTDCGTGAAQSWRIAPEVRIATVRYLVDDVDAALPFYAALGFTLAERWGPPFAIVEREDLTLWLSGPGTSARRPLADGREPRSGGWNRLVIEVVDLDETLTALQADGAQLRSAPIEGPGGRRVLVDDPSGNPIELFEARAS